MTYTTAHSTAPQNVPVPERKPVVPQMTMAEMAAQEVERTSPIFGCTGWKKYGTDTAPIRPKVMRVIELLRQGPMTTLEISEEMGIQRQTVNSYLASARALDFRFSWDRNTHKVTLVSEPDSVPDVPKCTGEV